MDCAFLCQLTIKIWPRDEATPGIMSLSSTCVDFNRIYVLWFFGYIEFDPYIKTLWA